jgi:hypothetical protein
MRCSVTEHLHHNDKLEQLITMNVWISHWARMIGRAASRWNVHTAAMSFVAPFCAQRSLLV